MKVSTRQRIADKKLFGKFKLALEESGKGVNVVCVDVYGKVLDYGRLVYITENGIYFYKNVSKNLGFPLEEDGSIIEEI